MTTIKEKTDTNQIKLAVFIKSIQKVQIIHESIPSRTVIKTNVIRNKFLKYLPNI